jgi:protein-tyrosine-phosphatase
MYTHEMNVHFICRGNVLRSFLAETYLRSLKLENITIISSGTNVNWNDPVEREYFSNTLDLLDRHGISSYVSKDHAEQLTQSRSDNQDITVCMNQRVVDEAAAIVELPKDVISWEIIDIGEGNRIVKNDREQYEEEIYKEITDKVDDLVRLHGLR